MNVSDLAQLSYKELQALALTYRVPGNIKVSCQPPARHGHVSAEGRPRHPPVTRARFIRTPVGGSRPDRSRSNGRSNEPRRTGPSESRGGALKSTGRPVPLDPVGDLAARVDARLLTKTRSRRGRRRHPGRRGGESITDVRPVRRAWTTARGLAPSRPGSRPRGRTRDPNQESRWSRPHNASRPVSRELPALPFR